MVKKWVYGNRAACHGVLINLARHSRGDPRLGLSSGLLQPLQQKLDLVEMRIVVLQVNWRIF